MNRSVQHCLIFLALAAGSLQAGTITTTIVGTPASTATGNCDPFGCPAFFGLGTYQQVYASSAFAGLGAVDIEDIGFFQSQVLNNGGTLGGGTFTISLSYTTEAPGSLTIASGPTANVEAGTDDVFFTAPLPAMTPYLSENILTFAGTPFAYDPSLGNLLMTVSVTGATNTPPFVFLDVSGASSAALTSSAYFGSMNAANSGGLVTGFNTTPQEGSAVPEPASVLLVVAGIGLIGYRSRRRAS